MAQQALRRAQRVGNRRLLDVHVERVAHHAAVGEPGRLPQLDRLLEPVQEVRLVSVPRLERDVDAHGRGVFAARADALDRPLPLVRGWRDWRRLHHGRRRDDDRRRSRCRREICDRAHVVHGVPPSAGIGIAEIAIGGVHRGDRADRDTGVGRKLSDPRRVVLLGLADELDRVVAEAGDALDRALDRLAVVREGVVGVPETSHQWLSRGIPFVSAMRWYLIAGFSTMPCDSSSTSARWISCHGVWLSGYR